MRACRFAGGKPPVMCVVFVMRVGEKLGESFAEGKAGPRKDASEPTDGSLSTSCHPAVALGAFPPGREGRNNDAHALAASGGSNRQDVFRAVVPQVVEVFDGLFVPASDIAAPPCLDETGFLDIGFRGPPRRTV